MGKQWNGRDIPSGETPETEIRWWVVEGLCPSGDNDEYWIRGWQEMLEFVRNQLDVRLEREDVAAGEEVAITFRLETGKLREYQETCGYDL